MSKINQVLVPSGKFVTVTFVTNQGEIRKINGRTGVKKYLKNGVKNINKSKYFLVHTRNGSPLFNAPRMINKSSIREIRANGIVAFTNKASQYSSTV